MLDFLNSKKDKSKKEDTGLKKEGEEEKAKQNNGPDDSGVLKMNLIRDEVVKEFDWRRNIIYLSFAIFLSIALVIGSYWGVIWWGEKKFASQKKAINEQKDFKSLNEDIGKAKEEKNKINDFEQKLDKAETLVDNHIYWNKFFKFLEDHTLSSVYFDNFSGGLEGEYTFSAEAKSLGAIEAQVNKFAKSEDYVKNVWVEGASLKPTNTGQVVSFKLNLSVRSPEIFTDY